MADRVSASIELGGSLTAAQYSELAEIIAGEGLSTEWDGKPFNPADRTIGEPLQLYAHEVAGGRFEELEEWCVENKVPYARWSGAYGGAWGAERVVFTGKGVPTPYTADEEDHIVICKAAVENLGSFDAILAHFDAADAGIPPLTIEGDPSYVSA